MKEENTWVLELYLTLFCHLYVVKQQHEWTEKMEVNSVQLSLVLYTQNKLLWWVGKKKEEVDKEQEGNLD